MGLKLPAAFRSWRTESQELLRKLVRPMVKMLMAVPAMIWSTRKRMASTARMSPSTPPVIMAATTPQ